MPSDKNWITRFLSLCFVPRVSVLFAIPVFILGGLDTLLYLHQTQIQGLPTIPILSFGSEFYAAAIASVSAVFALLTLGVWFVFGVLVGTGLVPPHVIPYCGDWTPRRLFLGLLIVAFASFLPTISLICAMSLGPSAETGVGLSTTPLLMPLFFQEGVVYEFLSAMAVLGATYVLKSIFGSSPNGKRFAENIYEAYYLRALFPIHGQQSSNYMTGSISPPLHGLCVMIERRLAEYRALVPQSTEAKKVLSTELHQVSEQLKGLVLQSEDLPFKPIDFFNNGWQAVEAYIVSRLSQRRTAVRVICSPFDHPELLAHLRHLEQAVELQLRMVERATVKGTESFEDYANRIAEQIVDQLPLIENRVEPIVALSCVHFATGDFLYPNVIMEKVEHLLADREDKVRPKWLYNATHLQFQDFEKFSFSGCDALLISFHRFFHCPEPGAVLLCRHDTPLRRDIARDGESTRFVNPRLIFAISETIRVMASGAGAVTYGVVESIRAKLEDQVTKHHLQISGWPDGIHSPFLVCIEPQNGFTWNNAQKQLLETLWSKEILVDVVELSGGETAVRISLSHFVDFARLGKVLSELEKCVRPVSKI